MADSLMQIDWWRLVKLAIALGVAGFIGYRFRPMVSNNPDAVNTVVAIFSILQAFDRCNHVYAEPTLQAAKNWQKLQQMKATVKRKLCRQKILFFLYLLTLGIALAMYLTPAASVEVLKWMQTVFLGLATFVFLASFSLPSSLMKIQMER